MSNVHPIFDPILNAIFPSKLTKKELPVQSPNQLTTPPKEHDATMEGFANWLIAGKPKL